MLLATISAQVARALVLVTGIVVMVFVLVRFVPGDAVDVLAIQGGFTEEQAEALRDEVGLSASLLRQFHLWSTDALQGDFGLSLRFRQPVADLLAHAVPVTLKLAGASLLLGMVLALSLALLATLKLHPLLVSMVDALNVWSISVPTFCAGLAGIFVFSLWLGWMPVLGNYVIPVVVLGLDAAGQLVKPLHEELKELSTAAHIRTARAKGLHPARIVARHLLPSAAPVFLALAGVVTGSFIAGALTMEVLFGLPGVGSLAFNAINGRDYPLIQVVVLFLAISVILVNTATDVAQRLIDPRPEN